MNPRRHFLKTTLGGTAGMIALPHLFSGSLFAADSPNKRIQVAQIGCGRMGLEDMSDVLNVPLARVVAVCELDTKRAAEGKRRIEEFYKKKGESAVDIKVYSDYRELLANPEIDAVVISTPDHWHGLMAVEAALAGKHMYVQKPLTYNIAEAIALRTAVRAKKVILQTGSQQRSERPFTAFRPAIEAVWNGRLGKLKTVQIGIGIDKLSGKKPAAMPIPATFNFDQWLGPAPQQDYMEGRCHPQDSFNGRPGWITTEDFGLGMITNWGAHHLDIAQLAMGQHLGGPSVVEAKADFMTNDVWTVHHGYHVEMLYPDNVQVILDDKFENGIKFEGEEGWIFCTRGAVKVTASDGDVKGDGKSALRASKASLISPLASDAKHLAGSKDHKVNWIESIIANCDPIANVDESARSLEACCVAWIAMKLGRKVTWDVATESFPGDAEANALCTRTPRRAEFDIAALIQKAGL
ncbi:MAG: Gfo/Idh/MocA family oxidoreductase [Akkermansiaceae bacterium]